MAARIMRRTMTLLAGFAVAAALFWALLNVPESNVMALGLSALLVLLIVIVTGLTVALAASVGSSLPLGVRLSRATWSLPAFVAALLVFAGLWWATGRLDTWWQGHAGEVDAAAIRYLGLARIGWLHRAVAALLWLLRWGLGLSIVLSCSTAAAGLGARAIGTGLRDAVRPTRLLLTALAALLVSQGVWRGVYWRPGALPPTQLEILFAAIKLGVLLTAAAVIASAAIAAHSRRRANLQSPA